MARSDDQAVDRFEQIKGSVLKYQFGFSRWLSAHGLTMSTTAATVVSGSSVTIGNQATSGNNWTGEVTAAQEGEAVIEITATPTTGNLLRKRRFKIDVTDPR